MKVKTLFRAMAVILVILMISSTFSACDMSEIFDGNDSTPLRGEQGEQGERGEKGEPGEKGEKGDKGDKGDPGASISNAFVNSIGHLILVLSDGTQIDAGVVGGGAQSGESYTVSGAVYKANGRAPISDAKIEIYADAAYSIMVAIVFSGSDGSYETSLPAGTYYVKIIAEGYISFESLQVIRDEATFLESFLMVEGDNNSNIDQVGSVGGCIKNSVTGSTVGEATLTIRKGWNKTEGEIFKTITTDSQGNYNVELPIGNYTIMIEKYSFIFNYINIVVTLTPNNGFNASIVPDGTSEIPTGDMRVVLSWGETPADLDSHLIGPGVSGDGDFHIYYSNSSYINNGTRKAFLDVDDTSSYGPETITVYSMNQSGVYSYYVHNYTNKTSSNSSALSSSNAKVQVYVGEELVATYNVPAAKIGTLWHVFDFDATTRRIVAINEFSNQASPEHVGS